MELAFAIATPVPDSGIIIFQDERYCLSERIRNGGSEPNFLARRGLNRRRECSERSRYPVPELISKFVKQVFDQFASSMGFLKLYV